MKKFIALGVALLVLLLNFVPTTNVAENEGIQVCEDIEPDPIPYN